MPSTSAFFTTRLPTCPTPTTPIASFSRSNPRVCAIRQTAAVTYSATLFALQPGAAHHAMWARSSQRVSMWSNPAVAVPTKPTFVSARSSLSTFVLDRITRTSASSRCSRDILRSGTTSVSPRVSKASLAKSTLDAHTIFTDRLCRVHAWTASLKGTREIGF